MMGVTQDCGVLVVFMFGLGCAIEVPISEVLDGVWMIVVKWREVWGTKTVFNRRFVGCEVRGEAEVEIGQTQ